LLDAGGANQPVRTDVKEEKHSLSSKVYPSSTDADLTARFRFLRLSSTFQLITPAFGSLAHISPRLDWRIFSCPAMLRGLIHSAASSSSAAAFPRRRLLRTSGGSSSLLTPGRAHPHHPTVHVSSYPIRSFFFSGKGDDGDNNNGKGGDGMKRDDNDAKKDDKSKKDDADPVDAEDKPKSSKVTKTFLGGTSSTSTSSSSSSDSTPPTKLGFGEEAPRYPHLLALPIVSKPFFPGVVSTVTLTDPKTVTAIENLSKEGTRYVGCFLRKDVPSGVTENGLVVDTPELITDPSELYSTGTFAQIMAINQGPGIGPEHMHAHPTRQDWDRIL
jgi:hypothetical protein